MRSSAWLMLMAAAAVGAAVIGVEHNPVRTHPTGIPAGAAQNIIVKLRATSAANSVQETEQEQQKEQQRITALAARTGIALQSSREIMTRLHVIHVRPAARGGSIAQIIARLQADPDVEYAEPDQRRYVHEAPPDDPLFDGTEQDDGAPLQQWYEQAPVPGTTTSATPSAVDAADAWNVTTGSNAIVIADIDNGVRFDHPDLLGAGTSGTVSATATATGRLLSGYCFITDSFEANGINCPGPDASDPGDWVTSADLNHSECSGASTANSSWHGTRVAGILGALTNNAVGIAGMTWNAWILPLRALGVCGGQDSDIESAMLWAAGISVPGYPANPYPAKIINLSIGGASSCPNSYQEVINQLTAAGVLVVASAGNEGGPVDAPANCPGVIAVAGLRQAGTKVGFSNLGSQVALAAPAGNCVTTTAGQPCLYSIISATNLGTTTPAQNGYTTDLINNPSLGTSFSAPIVSGIAALMLAANGNLTPDQLTALLEQTATPFPQTSEGESSQPPMCQNPTTFGDDTEDMECICTNPNANASPPVPVTCGYGMANASAAVTAALNPIAAITVQPANVTPGTTVTLNASGSGAACGDSIASYQWSSSSGSDPVSSASGATTTAQAPSSGTVTVTLTVTDSGGHESTATAIIDSTSASTIAPASAGSTACLTPITVVSVAPSGPSAQAGGDPVAFTASVGDNTDSAVTWQVNGVAGGNATYGTISSSGLYTPPAMQPSSPNVMVTAISAADPTRSGWTQLTITPPGSSSSSSSSSTSSSSTSSSSSSSSSSSDSTSSSSSASSSSQGGSAASGDPTTGKSGGGAVDLVTLFACGLVVAFSSQRRLRRRSVGRS